MASVDRSLFVPEESRQEAYYDAPQPIGFGATISAPHMHAHCLELLKDYAAPGAKVLDIGSGSGYLTAAFGWLVSRGGAPGSVVGVEHIPQLNRAARTALARIDWAQRMLQEGRIKVVEGDGFAGYCEHAPYDAIHVGAAAPDVPRALLEQLAPGGRLVLPVGEAGEMQSLVTVDKAQDGRFKVTELDGVAYVPLTTKEQQLRMEVHRQRLLRSIPRQAGDPEP